VTLRWPVGRAVAAVVVLALMLLAGGPARSAAPATGPAPFGAMVAGGCTTAPANDTPSGTLSIDGGPLAANASTGVPIDYSFHFDVRIYHEATNETVLFECERGTVNVTTGPSGDFAFGPVVPPLDCTKVPGYCLAFSGPFSPVSIAPAGPAPAGYAVSVSGGPSVYSVDYVDELASVAISPGGTTFTASPGEPVPFVADGRMANGTATPLAPAFAWTLNGSGWSFSGPATGAEASVVAVAGAAVGTLSVVASARSGSVLLSTPPAVVTLIAQPTAIETAELSRTTIDAGSTVAVRLSGVGAAGFAYTAKVDPGLDLAPVVAPCGVDPGTGGTVDVSCSANVTYPDPGIAQPTGRLTNGYSSSLWQFPDVTVDAAPVLSVDPAAPIGYVDVPVPVVVAAANGTGTVPFARACLSVVLEPTDCLTSPGPDWRFSPRFPTPGTYAAVAWAIDADGENASVAFSVSVVAPLTVGPIGVGPANLTAGSVVDLSATIAGGDLPLRYWWNGSDVNGSILAGRTTVDGALSTDFVPPAAASVTVTLTVVDALGTLTEAERLLAVAPAPAITIAAFGPPPSPEPVAGRAFDVGWKAYDRSGAAVVGFGAAATVSLSEDGRPIDGTVNASGLGPLASLGVGLYGLPAGAWEAGAVELSVAETTAGTLTVALAGAALPGPVAPVTVVVVPDGTHLRLFDPVVADAGARANATFWHLSDRYGNPAPGAFVTVRLRWSGASRSTVEPAVVGADGTTGVWVNYSAPGAGGANVTVLDAAGDVLLGPISIPGLPTAPAISSTAVTLGAAVPVGALGAAWSGIVARRARRRALVRTDDEELRRLAEGRGQAVELVRRAGAADLDEIAAAWRPAPAPPDLAEWIASLVADGTLGARVGDDGRARFCLAPSRPSGPVVTVDAQALDLALKRRDEALDDDPPDG